MNTILQRGGHKISPDSPSKSAIDIPEITHLIQDEIVQWLGEKKEMRAQEWFGTYWTGKFGNYTNATAGY